MNAISCYELIPQNVQRKQKSYYGKAKVVICGNDITLKSYDTNVCSYNTQTHEFIRVWNGYSATTMKHINDFLTINNIQGGGKKWWTSLPVNKSITVELK